MHSETQPAERAPQHKCPAPACEVRVPQSQLACRPHWYALPKPLRDEIWRAYRNGQERTHWNAVREAIALLEGRQPESETMRLPQVRA